MAKGIKQRKNEGKATKITTKSWFGSHSDMVIKHLDNNKVLLQDNFGQYITDRWRLDNGEADPNRYAQNRIDGKIECDEINQDS